MTRCCVLRCPRTASAWFTREIGGMPFDYPVCAEHLVALDAGADYDVDLADPGAPVLLMGEDAPFEVLKGTVTDNEAGWVWTLELGRGGEYRKTVHLRVPWPGMRWQVDWIDPKD